MATSRAISLLDPDSGQPFQSLHLDLPGGFVRSHVLHGGLQEGVQVVEIQNGNMGFAVLPSRGMSLWKASYGDLRLGWDSPVKRPVHPSFMRLEDRGGLGWLNGFNEWVVRCGLNSMGPPGPDPSPLPLHGRIANLPAHSVSLEIHEEGLTLRGAVDETTMLGPALRLDTEIRIEWGKADIRIRDTVTNLGATPQEHMLLYHVNYGENLLGEGARFHAPFRRVTPRDTTAVPGIPHFCEFSAPSPGYREQVFFMRLLGDPRTGESLALLHNAAADKAAVLRFSLDSLPCFILWKHTAGLADGYVTGLEPATCFPNFRAFERRKGRVIELAPGESRTTELCLEVLDTPEEVESVVAHIRRLQEQAAPEILPLPDPEWSGS